MSGATTAPSSPSFQNPAARTLLRRHRFAILELLPWVLAIAAFYLFPGYRLLATQVLVLILFALSVDLIVGYAGIVTLGHTAYFGTGAYAAAMLARPEWQESICGLIGASAECTVGAQPVIGVVAGCIVGGLLGWLSGLIILRTRELTLLMLTLALTFILHELAKDIDGLTGTVLTGGFDGINFSPAPVLGLFEFDPIFYSTNYWYALGILFVGFLFIRTLIYSPFGTALVGIRENVRRMHAIGSPVQNRMLTVYTISCAIAGVAGAVWVQIQGNITIAVYEFDLAGGILIMVILGGTGRLYGAFIGVVVYMILENLTETVLGTDPPYWELVVGGALVLTVLFAPRGLLGIGEDVGKLVGRKRT